MAGIANVWLRMNLRLSAFLMRKGGIPFARAAQDKLGRLGARAVGARVEFVPHAFREFQAAWILPQGYDPEGGAILYLHGGGYTAGNIEYAVGFGSVLAAATGCRVFSAAYRLAPEHPFPAAVEDAYTAYRHLLDSGLTPGEIVLCGESAGGGLCFALTHKLKQLGLSVPRLPLVIPRLDFCHPFSPRSDAIYLPKKFFFLGRHIISAYTAPLCFVRYCLRANSVPCPYQTYGQHCRRR